MNLIECKIKFQKMLGNGMPKKVTESYLVDALSFTEAEARIIEEMQPFITGEFKVTAVKQEKYAELFADCEGDSYYKCKIAFITLDEKSGAEKQTKAYMCVRADSVKEAIANLEEGMKGTLADYAIQAVSETTVMDIFLYEE